MQGTSRISPKMLIMVSLLATICLILFLSGIGLFAIVVSVTIVGLLLWWFCRGAPPEGESPCASVSCCHYLGDRQETESEQLDQ